MNIQIIRHFAPGFLPIFEPRISWGGDDRREFSWFSRKERKRLSNRRVFTAPAKRAKRLNKGK